MPLKPQQLRHRIRMILMVFVVGLVLSGITAVPLWWEVGLLHSLVGPGTTVGGFWPALADWIAVVYRGLADTRQNHPFLFYGTDWLAFAHIVIAIAFWGPLRNPVQNRWVIDFGIIACILVVPTAIIFGQARGIPPFWRMIDASFGVIGVIPLVMTRRYINMLMKMET